MPVTFQSLFDDAACYACYGALTDAQLMKLAMLKNLLLEVAPGSNTSAAYLVQYGQCFACVGMSMADIMEIALLNLLSGQITAGGGACAGGELICGNYDGGAPTDTPTGSCAIAYDLDGSHNRWLWNGSAWI